MKSHLSEDQITEVLIGEADSWTLGHLKTCDRCRAQIAMLTGALGNFRAAVHEQSAADCRPILTSGRPTMRPLHLSFAVAALAVPGLVSIPSAPQRQTILQSDIALLTQIDAQVSRYIPEAMEPLSQLTLTEGN